MSATFFVERLQTFFFIFSTFFFTFFNVLYFHLNVYYIYGCWNIGLVEQRYLVVSDGVVAGGVGGGGCGIQRSRSLTDDGVKRRHHP